MPLTLKKTDDTAAVITTAGLVAVAAYIAAQMLADITSNKMGLFLGQAIDMGTFIYPVTFTLRDVVHKQLGKKKARLIIVLAGVINVLMAAYLYFTAVFPSHPDWMALQAPYTAIFAVTPRIVIASIVAEIVSELIDTEAYHLFVTRVTTRHHWLRVLVSNAVSVPVDSLIFCVGAFAFVWSWPDVWGTFTWNVIIKGIVTVISIPLIYLVPEKKHGPVTGGKR
jgi:queuosine precursor transporter